MDPLNPSVTDALAAWRVQLDAGLPLVQALQAAGRVCKPAPARRLFELAADAAGRGEGFEVILQTLSPIVTYPERMILTAGWSGGRTDDAFGSVLRRRELLFRTRRSIRSGLILPGIVLVAACLIAPLPALLLGGTMSEYLLRALTPLAIAAAICAGIAAAARWRSAQWSRLGADAPPPPPTIIDHLLLMLPVARGIERWRNLAEFGLLLSAMLEAGCGMIEALRLCAPAAPNGLYRHAIRRCAQTIKDGEPLSRAIAASPLWPDPWVAHIEVAEISGQLDDVLKRIGAEAQEQYAQRVLLAGQWLPRIAYGLVSLYVLTQIMQLWSQTPRP